ncbi:hypothetical protein D0Z07_2618 [Hyphodiscus hymeniophilus]|uniref:HCNGP-domain-containing protein n=1 Tax=Hyphodiscus hymeniophilus TaxID=353542 RepID=A0A9P6VNM5_9HELO|nr:hypothetical protein D0Z07_2618 [Hyphodiscus hymeniophilus]
MAGLVNYASSEDEDEAQERPSHNIETADHRRQSTELATPAKPSINGSTLGSQINGSTTKPPAQPPPDAPLVGPALGPSMADIEMTTALEDENGPPQSPYSANRALLRDLTLPTAPNYDIPPSPPSSPVGSTDAKFKKFLDLKKQGVHFNEKLAKSSALKNPSLMQKLMDFSDIDEAGQYATTLPKDLWNSGPFPGYAFKEELAKSQQKILKRKEEEKLRGPRESVDFVPATITEPSSRSGPPAAGGKGTQKSAAERIMAGLDRGRSSSPQVAGTKRKTRFDS